MRILHALQSFVQCHDRDFEVFFPQFQSRFISSQNVVFALWVITILSTFCCRLHFPRGFRFLAFIWLLNFRCSTHFFFIIVQLLPFAAFNSFVNRLAKGMSISVYQGRSPPVLRNVTNIDTRILGDNFFSSRRQFLGTLHRLTPRSTPLRTLAFVPQTALYLPSDGPLPGHSDCQLQSKFLKPSIIPFLLLSQRREKILWIGLSPSFCWFANNLGALIKFSHRPCGTAWALKTFA